VQERRGDSSKCGARGRVPFWAYRDHGSQLIEQGLRAAIAERTRGTGFTLRQAAFRGDGLVAGRSLQDWASIRDLVYTERGA